MRRAGDIRGTVAVLRRRAGEAISSAMRDEVPMEGEAMRTRADWRVGAAALAGDMRRRGAGAAISSATRDVVLIEGTARLRRV